MIKPPEAIKILALGAFLSAAFMFGKWCQRQTDIMELQCNVAGMTWEQAQTLLTGVANRKK